MRRRQSKHTQYNVCEKSVFPKVLEQVGFIQLQDKIGKSGHLWKLILDAAEKTGLSSTLSSMCWLISYKIGDNLVFERDFQEKNIISLRLSEM